MVKVKKGNGNIKITSNNLYYKENENQGVYDIHTGEILGLTGKILAFIASLIAASLPITGFYIWWGRKKKRKWKHTYPENIKRSELEMA